jgi:hypothetical protein
MAADAGGLLCEKKVAQSRMYARVNLHRPEHIPLCMDLTPANPAQLRQKRSLYLRILSRRKEHPKYRPTAKW